MAPSRRRAGVQPVVTLSGAPLVRTLTWLPPDNAKGGHGVTGPWPRFGFERSGGQPTTSVRRAPSAGLGEKSDLARPMWMDQSEPDVVPSRIVWTNSGPVKSRFAQ
jgi:hypothetical protein